MRLRGTRAFATLITALTLSVSAGCSDQEDKDDSETDTGSGLPKINSIDMSRLGTAEANLVEGECTQSENMGVFGLALGGACNTAPLAESLLIGSTEVTEEFSCLNDYNPDDTGTGIMVHLLCHGAIEDNTTSFSFEDENSGDYIGISFASFGSGSAKGSWSPDGKESYPADIRMFSGNSLSSLEGVFALELTDINTGKIQVSMEDDGDLDYPIRLSLTFQNQEGSTTDCQSEPGTNHCHWQEVKLYSGEGVPSGPPNGFHLRVYADDKQSPTFLAGQGAYTYSAAKAAELAAAAGMSAFADLRTIRFEFVQKGTQVWGRFDFQDAAGDTLSGAGGLFSLLADADGLCHNLGEDEATLCIEVDPGDYSDLWDSNFTVIEESPVQEGIFDEDQPTEAGVHTD